MYRLGIFESADGLAHVTKSSIEEREWLRALLKGVDDLLDEMVD